MQIDENDRRILRYLLADPDAPAQDVAIQAGVSVPTYWRRMEKLREEGVISGRQAVINWRALGYEVEVSLRFTLDKTNPRAFDDFISAARLVAEVINIETFLGRVDVRLNVIARDMAHYQQIYRDHILTLPHIADIEAFMLISTIKNSMSLPL